MEGLSTAIDFEMGGPEDQDDAKAKAPYHTNDYWADTICQLYRSAQTDAMFLPKIVLMGSGPLSVVLFAMFVSSNASTLVAYTTFVVALMFVGISLNMLGWILDKDIGPRSMQEIAEPIKEGSEGFFLTQYGTIFKLAFATAIGLFFIYNLRDAVPDSELNHYFSTFSMALIMSISFLIGACCSAISGYAGIWVSVRANLRVAAASRTDYNAAL